MYGYSWADGGMEAQVAQTKEISVVSTIDQTEQPSLFWEAQGENRPLIVALHTWSFDRFNQEENYIPYAKEMNWHLLLPEFRGANTAENPCCREACASQKAMQDILDAVEHVCKNYSVDRSRIFIMGGSGGGHMAMMMCAYAPKLWRCAVAYVPITNIAQWYEEKLAEEAGYAKDIVACLGGKTPAEDPQAYAGRSPDNYVEKIALSNLKIFHGKYDPVVSVRHSLAFYSEMMRRYPDSRVFLEIFDGGHESCLPEGFRWMLSQLDKKQTETLTG